MKSTDSLHYTIKNKETILDGFFQIEKVVLDIDRFDGGSIKNLCRFALHRPEAVAIILENITNGTIVLVEQFRYSSLRSPYGNGWVTEIIAGIVESGEELETCGKREILEEAGYKIDSLEFIFSYFPSIGISDEMIHLFYGQVEQADKISEGGGLEEENEDIHIIEKHLPQVIEDIRLGKIIDAKTIIAAQWLASKKQIPAL